GSRSPTRTYQHRETVLMTSVTRGSQPTPLEPYRAGTVSGLIQSAVTSHFRNRARVGALGTQRTGYDFANGRTNSNCRAADFASSGTFSARSCVRTLRPASSMGSSRPPLLQPPRSASSRRYIVISTRQRSVLMERLEEQVERLFHRVTPRMVSPD